MSEQEQTEQQRSAKSKSKLVPILVFIFFIIAVGFYGFFFLGHQDNLIQGEAEITEVRVSSKVPGRIDRFLVSEGDYVSKGDTVAILRTPDIDAKLIQAQAAVEAANAQNLKAIKGARTEQIRSAYEIWQKAVAGLDIAKKSFDRVQRLYDQGVVTAQKRDEAEANYKASAATEKAARSQYDMAVNGAEPEDRRAALAQLERAQGAVAEVESYLGETIMVSPVDGRVSQIFPNESELVGSGAPVMNIMDLTDKWGAFNIREDRLKGYAINEEFQAYVPALDTFVTMKIYYIKDLGSYAAWKATKPTGEYDRKTFEVRARFTDNTIDILPGMTLVIKEDKQRRNK